MIVTDIHFINPMGLHSRPCGVFAKMAKKYSCKVTIAHQDKEADARSMLALMKLGVVHGSNITLRCDGEQEQEASETLSHYLSTLVEKAE